MTYLTNDQINASKKFLGLFKIDDKPANEVASQGQIEIFASIVFKTNPRIACLAPTGYGKSEFISMGAVIRSAVMGDPFVIASVKYGTSDIIMKKTINHIFDDPHLIAELAIDSSSEFESLKRERKKSSINFKKGGSLKVISLHGAENAVVAIGEHAPNIILDESPLLTPTKYLQVKKILEGTGDYNSTFLFELGNAVNRNHFRQNIKFNPDYQKLDISLDQALKEGRIDPKMVEDQRGLPLFKEFYLCEFPDEEEIDEKGFRQLITEDQIKKAMVDEVEILDEPHKLGADVAGGGDHNVYNVRNSKFAWFDGHNQSNDTMTNVVEVESRIDKYKIKPKDVYIDDIGIGRGVTDRLKEKKLKVNGVSVGMPSTNKSRFANIKAENYWSAKLWIEGGGKLKNDPKWYQMTWIRYKVNSDKVIIIEPKKDLKVRTGKSPDYAESFMLTFSKPEPVPTIRTLG